MLMFFVSYLLYMQSWLRVLLRYHTISQVVVGAVLGSLFSVLWFRSWETIVHKAYHSNMSVRIFVFIGAACCCLELIASVVKQALGNKWTSTDWYNNKSFRNHSVSIGYNNKQTWCFDWFIFELLPCNSHMCYFWQKKCKILSFYKWGPSPTFHSLSPPQEETKRS